MKYILILLILFPSTSWGQQLLWTTNDTISLSNDEVRVIPKNEVIKHVLEYHDHYSFYNDLTGFSKEGFMQFAESNNIASQMLKNSRILQLEEHTALAFKGNTGSGSVIIVMLLRENNIDVIAFSNEWSKGAIISASYDSQKFKRWFSTMWPENTENQSSKPADIFANRRWVVLPQIKDDGRKVG